MKKILIKLFGFFAVILFIYRKGASNKKAEIDNNNNQSTINEIKKAQEIQSNSASLDRVGLTKRL
jgi:cbb3-type cytochrome oxidase subunit 3